MWLEKVTETSTEEMRLGCVETAGGLQNLKDPAPALGDIKAATPTHA